MNVSLELEFDLDLPQHRNLYSVITTLLLGQTDTLPKTKLPDPVVSAKVEKPVTEKPKVTSDIKDALKAAKDAGAVTGPATTNVVLTPQILEGASDYQMEVLRNLWLKVDHSMTAEEVVDGTSVPQMALRGVIGGFGKPKRKGLIEVSVDKGPGGKRQSRYTLTQAGVTLLDTQASDLGWGQVAASA